MVDDIDGDVFEARLIKNAVARFNDILPVVLPNVRARVMHAFELEDLDRCVDTTAYASNILWSLRRYFEKNPVDGWKLIGRRDCLHMKHESDGLEMRFTKAFKFTGALSPAGGNRSRRRAYIQGRLRTKEEMLQLFDYPSLKDDIVQIAWTEEHDQFSFTAYVPKEPGKFPRSPEAWLVFPIGVAESEYNELAFQSSEEAPLLVPKHNLIVGNDMLPQKKIEETIERK
ncbi:hypothetical protein [Bifidobacterium sp.]|uniref:hypothetical protein n=1 Tax=Bifidobacterium sp. TaxID=41200 RepID=UPI003F7B775C